MHSLPQRKEVPDGCDCLAQYGLDHCPEAVLLADAEGRLLYGNRAICQVLGWSAQELHQHSILELLPAWRSRASNAGADSVEASYRHRDGRTISIETTPMRALSEEATYYWIFVRDLTKGKRLAEQLRGARKRAAVGQLVESVAHDFNNLLTAILIYADLLLNHTEAQDVLRHPAEQINLAAERGRALIAHLLAFGRKPTLEPAVLLLNQVIEELHDMLGRLAGEHIVVETSCVQNLGPVHADRTQIERLLVNLAVNARDAMPQGGKLSITTANFTADEHSARRFPGLRRGDYVVLAVSDNGCGMEAATQLRAFDPFFTTKVPGRGTGLGLSTVHSIVRQSGGHLHLESAPGRGTRVRIFLPRIREEAGEVSAPRTSKRETGVVGTVLLVEDEELVRRSLRESLTSRGYRVLEARDPGDAKRLANEHEAGIDLMLTNLVMPGMSGIELAKRILPGHPETRVLYITDYREDGRIRRLREAGKPFLCKPFTASAIAEKVSEVLTPAASSGNPAGVMPVTEGQEGDT